MSQVGVTFFEIRQGIVRVNASDISVSYSHSFSCTPSGVRLIDSA